MANDVILVEDEPGHQDAIQRFVLEPAGFNVKVCANLPELIGHLAAINVAPKGVLLDFRIPRVVGSDPELEGGRDCGMLLRGLLRGHLAEVPITLDVPIVAYTEHQDQKFAGWADIIGISEILVKRQLSIDDIESTVKAFFR